MSIEQKLILQQRENAEMVTRRAVGVVTTHIVETHGPGGLVVLEGPPIYQHLPWDAAHGFGYNIVMPRLRDDLGQKMVQTKSLVLIDELNTEPEFFGSTSRTHVDYMRVKPSGVIFESHLIRDAEVHIRESTGSGLTYVANGMLYLNHNHRPVLVRTPNGNPSCELLDSVFQENKRGCDATVIVHPTTFRDQQEGMRLLLRQRCGGELPFDIYTILFKTGCIPTITEVTYSSGKEQDVKLG